MNENDVKESVKKILAKLPNVKLFVNPSGNGYVGQIKNNQSGLITLINFRRIQFGLGAHKGSSDFIGWQTVKITPDMVGENFARFLSVETKAPGKLSNTSNEQELWIAMVNRSGGKALVIDDAAMLIPALGGSSV